MSEDRDLERIRRSTSQPATPSALDGAEVTVTDHSRTHSVLSFAYAPGASRRMIPILGTRAVLRYRLDPDEHQRRRRQRLGAITSPDVLRLLLGLP